MNDNWREIASVESPAKAALIQGLLEENKIPVIVLNQKDSSYMSFGFIKIHVRPEDVIQAKQLIKDFAE